MGPSRTAVLKQLRAGRPKLPITLGRYAPQAVIKREGDAWVLRPLRIDQERAAAAGREALAGGRSWMPEMEWQFIVEDPPIVFAPDRDAFVAALEALPWTYSDE